jgi:Na+/H+ antiporter NhaD/arsenite permease-like protein
LIQCSCYRHDLKDKPCHDRIIADLERDYVIHDLKLFYKVVVILVLVVASFFLERITHIEPAWSALGGAAILLLIATPHEIDKFLEKVEWSTLLFFAGLFILVEGLKLMGLIRFIGDTVGYPN